MVRSYGWPERIMVWVLTLVFVAAGAAKFAHVPDVVAVFTRFHLPEWFMYVTACVEILGALALHWRRGPFRFAGPGLLAITMLVGAGFHVIYDTLPDAIPALVLASLAGLVLILRRPAGSAV